MEVERALEYVELYGLYTECEAIYSVDNLLAMWDGLDAADRATFAFDPRASRLADVHQRDPPAVDRPARPRQDDAGQDDAPTAPAACAARCSTPTATSPPSTSRTR